jgi:hypothetical protein
MFPQPITLTRVILAVPSGSNAIPTAVSVVGTRGAGLTTIGEHYDSRTPADTDARPIGSPVRDIDDAGIDCCLPAKLSQTGLDTGRGAFEGG